MNAAHGVTGKKCRANGGQSTNERKRESTINTRIRDGGSVDDECLIERERERERAGKEKGRAAVGQKTSPPSPSPSRFPIHDLRGD